MKHSIPLWFLCLFIFAFPKLKLTSAACHVDDESGLLAFKSGITHDPSGMLTSWKPGTNCCTWIGVSCGTNNRVDTLTLVGQPEKPNMYLTGTISPSLSKLRYLNSIYIQNLRNISGPFPSFILQLPNLLFVYIENNKLSGPIPQNIGKLSRLEALSFSNNRFTGPIPKSIFNLSQLTQLKLDNNHLTGLIPTKIQNLQKLTYLGLNGNRLSGPIPNIFKSFSKLIFLSLSQNNLSGPVPPTISDLAPNLRFLELGHNSLSGKIPNFLGKFKALDTLDLSNNKFSGIVPKSFTNLTKIFNLNLAHNSLNNPFPEMNVKGIESLDLSYNNFKLGKIPKWVTSSTIIYSLKLAKCGIKMSLDDWNPAETYFYDYIDLSENEIIGSPVRVLNRTELLVSFKAAGNRLKFDIGKLRVMKSLKELDLSRNSVVGNLPKGIGGLERLNVSYNHLCGRIPEGSKFPASAFAGNDCLCGSPLPPCKG